jgi:hypothetical protein
MVYITSLTGKSQEKQEHSFYSTLFTISTNALPPLHKNWLAKLETVTLDGEHLRQLLTTPTKVKTLIADDAKRLRLITDSKNADTEAKQKAAKNQLDAMKAQGGYVVLGVSATGGRLAADMVNVSCVGIDIDDGAISESQLVAKLEASGLMAIYCSTFKSVQGGGERWRVIVPLAYEVEANAIKQQAMIEELAERFGVVNDPQAKDTSRLFYLPVICEGGRVTSGIVEGQLFNPVEAEHREPAIKDKAKKSGRLDAILNGTETEQSAWLDNARGFEWVSGGKNKDGSIDMREIPRTVQANIANSQEQKGRDRDVLFQGFITACIGAAVWNPDEIISILDRLEKDGHPVGQKWAIYQNKDPMRQLARSMIKATIYMKEQTCEGEALVYERIGKPRPQLDRSTVPAFMLRNTAKGE